MRAIEILRFTWRYISALLMLISGLVFGCVGVSNPPVLDRSPQFVDQENVTYVVKVKDSLYSIAWHNNLDPLELAAWNGIKPPYIIRPGQVLNITSGISIARSRSKKTNVVNRSAKQAPVDWQWPVDTNAQCCFGSDQKGLNYLLVPGQRVVSAGAGRVVYSGSGLRGFRYLLILKHDDGYLSAYSINAMPGVVEGDTVEVGTTLTQITNEGALEKHFYFEVRHGGSAIDPKKVINP